MKPSTDPHVGIRDEAERLLKTVERDLALWDEEEQIRAADVMRALLAELDRQGPRAWRPIEEWPVEWKDGREFLVRVKRAGCIGVVVVHYCEWVEDHPPIDPGLYYWSGFDFRPLKDKPTHFQALPPAPSQEST